jgi:hypothetical protein
MKRALCAAVASAAVASVGLPASASAVPPVIPPEGSACTFHRGLTTCVHSGGFGTVGVEIVDDRSCPSGKAERLTDTTITETTTTVFRGTRQLGEPRTETTTSMTVTTTCAEL